MTLGLIVGAVVLAIDLVVGRAIGVASKPKPPRQDPPNLRCGCGHHLSSHDPENNTCHETRSVALNQNRATREIKYHEVQCICRQYTGDKLIDTYFPQRMIEP